MKVKIEQTERGFNFAEFTDRYGCACSIQKSSLATEDAIWFGIDNADPKIMVSDAKRMGIETKQENGWCAYPIPKEVLLSTRMHLTREMVESLLPLLKTFVETGNLHP